MNKVAKAILIVLCAAGVFTLSAMSVFHIGRTTPADIDPVTRQKADHWNKQAIGSAVSLLRQGNIVLRMGAGADSRLLAELNTKNKTYSHCGIVMIEHGYPFVYHSIGGEDNPDERLRRDSANFFFSPKHSTGIAIVQYDFNDAALNTLKNIVCDYYKARPKFDMKFDLKTDDKLYCAEFVYKAVNKAMNDASYIKTTTRLGYTFVGIDDIFLNPHAHIIWQTGFK